MRNSYSGRILCGLLAVLGTAASAVAAAQFDFKDPKGVNTVYFVLDSELEPIMGLASGVSGKISFDPAAPKDTSGEIKIDAKTMYTQNKGMTDTLRNKEWMDAESNPEITFKFKEVKEVKTKDGTQEMTVVGDFTCKGVTKELTVPVRATHQAGRLGDRMQGKKGDLLVLRSEFTIKRSDFGIKAGMPGAVVAEEIQIRASIVGSCPEK